MADNEPEPEKVPSMENPDPSPGNPSYTEMIMTALRALNEPNGSSKAAISKYIQSNFPNVSASHSALLLHHLRLLKENGSLVMEKHCYKLPSESQGNEPNSAPAKRGRGRPPKPKIGVPATGSPRPRGRPPKPKVGVPPAGPPRPRGRPPKPKIGVPAAGSPRPRGRPPKPKVGVLSPVGSPPSRGRPPKKPKVAAEPTGAPRLRGRPPKVGGTSAVPAGGSPRPRGRPPKPKDLNKPSVSPLPKGSRPRGRPPKVKPAEVPAVEVPQQ